MNTTDPVTDATSTAFSVRIDTYDDPIELVLLLAQRAFHPAITRPGRCLGEIEVGPLPATQARDWLGHALPPGTADATLAELFAMRREAGPMVAVAPSPSTGAYL